MVVSLVYIISWEIRCSVRMMGGFHFLACELREEEGAERVAGYGRGEGQIGLYGCQQR